MDTGPIAIISRFEDARVYARGSDRWLLQQPRSIDASNHHDLLSLGCITKGPIRQGTFLVGGKRPVECSIDGSGSTITLLSPGPF